MSRSKPLAGALLGMTAVLVLGAVAASATLNQRLTPVPGPHGEHHGRIPGFVQAIEARSDAGEAFAGITDAQDGLGPLPLNVGEQEKLARAREAVAAAEAAGTRWVDPIERNGIDLGEDSSEEKLRLRGQIAPKPLSHRPGVAPGAEEGAR